MSAGAWMAFAAAAASGSVARHRLAARLDQREGVPLGTLSVNLIGALALGVIAGLRMEHRLSGTAVFVLGTGFCGALTTFSAFAVQTVGLDRAPGRATAAWYLAATIAGAALLAGVGLAVAVSS